MAKAKALRQFVEPVLTKSKTDSTHSRRLVFKSLQSKEATIAVFSEVAPKIANREGGYTRIIRTGTRLGDNAEMCMIELVDFNELMLNDAPAKKTTRRSRSKGGASKAAATETAAESTDEAAAEEPKAEDKKTEE